MDLGFTEHLGVIRLTLLPGGGCANRLGQMIGSSLWMVRSAGIPSLAVELQVGVTRVEYEDWWQIILISTLVRSAGCKNVKKVATAVSSVEAYCLEFISSGDTRGITLQDHITAS